MARKVLKIVTGIAPVDRFIVQLLDVLNPQLENGPDRLQGADVPKPTDLDDGKALKWDARNRRWYLG